MLIQQAPRVAEASPTQARLLCCRAKRVKFLLLDQNSNESQLRSSVLQMCHVCLIQANHDQLFSRLAKRSHSQLHDCGSSHREAAGTRGRWWERSGVTALSGVVHGSIRAPGHSKTKKAQRTCLCWFSALLLTTNQWFLVLPSKRTAAEHGKVTGKKIPPGAVVTLDQAVRVASQLPSPQLILQSDRSLEMALFQGRQQLSR